MTISGSLPDKTDTPLTAKQANATADTGADFGVQAELWLTADKLRNTANAAEYKRAAVGPIFVRYICGVFESHCAKLVQGQVSEANPDLRADYVLAN